MAFYDWNHNGRKDSADGWMDYNLSHDQTKHPSGGHRGRNRGNDELEGCGCLLAMAFAAFVILWLLSKCAA